MVIQCSYWLIRRFRTTTNLINCWLIVGVGPTTRNSLSVEKSSAVNYSPNLFDYSLPFFIIILINYSSPKITRLIIKLTKKDRGRRVCTQITKFWPVSKLQWRFEDKYTQALEFFLFFFFTAHLHEIYYYYIFFWISKSKLEAYSLQLQGYPSNQHKGGQHFAYWFFCFLNKDRKFMSKTNKNKEKKKPYTYICIISCEYL